MTIKTQTIQGIVQSTISSTVEGPVDGYRAYAATVNTGLESLIDNDVTLNFNKIDGKYGGLYTPTNTIEINGTNGNKLHLGTPISFKRDIPTSTRGFVKSELIIIDIPNNTSTEVNPNILPLGHINCLYDSLVFQALPAVQNHTHWYVIKVLNDGYSYSNYIGKTIKLFLNRNWSSGQLNIKIRMFDNQTAYNNNSTSYSENFVQFGMYNCMAEFQTLPMHVSLNNDRNDFAVTGSRLMLVPTYFTDDASQDYLDHNNGYPLYYP